MPADAKEYISLLDQMRTYRGTWETTWERIQEHVMPNRAPIISTETPGARRNEFTLYDDTAPKANARLAAALNSTLTNRSTVWFALETIDDDLNETQQVKEWLELLAARIRRELENSNFYTQVNELYLDLGGIGTGVMFIGDSMEAGKTLNFSTRHIRECYLEENAQGRVDTVYRVYEMTARQMMQQWSDGRGMLPDAVQRSIDSGEPNTMFEVLHAVFPRHDADMMKKDRQNLPWASVWVDVTHVHVIDEGGYNEFPYVTPVWSKGSGEKYGRSPSLNNLADIMTLNKMKKTLLRTGEKVADPPLNVPDDMEEDPDLTPGGVNYFESGTQSRIEPINLGGNLPITLEMVERAQDDVRDGYMVTQLSLIDRRQMTAEEVRTRTQENAMILGPTFDRLQTEFLEMLIGRVMGILARADMLIDIPDELQGKETRVRYVSPLARAQRASEANAVTNVVGVAGQWSEINPAVMDNIDMDEAIRTIADVEGVPSTVLRPMEGDVGVKAIRRQRAKVQKEAMDAQKAQQQASTGKDVAQAKEASARALQAV